MIKVEQQAGISGEFQVIVRRADGSVKLDTGMQKNLVLDNGIKHYLLTDLVNNAGNDVPHRNGIMRHCVVGTGNTEPQFTDVALQSIVAANKESRELEFGKEEPGVGPQNHENYVKVWRRLKYVFDEIDNQNITEVGLACYVKTVNNVADLSDYILCTRALIRDSSNTPITVTVLPGEVLEVVYQINMYIDIRKKFGTFTLTTTEGGNDTTATYDYFLQPHSIAAGENLDNALIFDRYYHGVKAWGALPGADASYDIDDAEYQNITHLSVSALSNKVNGVSATTGWHTKYQSGYIESEVIEADINTKRRTVKVLNGIYTHVFDDGIRAFEVYQGNGPRYILVKELVVVKNQDTGTGIMKTSRQIWEFQHSYTLTRF